MQIASFMCRSLLPSAACLSLSYFSTLYHKHHEVRKKNYLM
jgi:hypothetical protein